jgi:HD superfamily phosphohydrolase
MKNILDIYCEHVPEELKPFLSCAQVTRLKDVGMHCGLEYTSYPFYKDFEKYSRYNHSVGVALITYNFTHNIKETLASLFHDISTPCFAHVIDFLNGDYIKQESTEEKTNSILSNSDEIVSNLKQLDLTVDQVSDYHLYPIADNDTPRLSADRLEYTLHNFANFWHLKASKIEEFYSSLIVSTNEDNEKEISFKDEKLALEFTLLTLKNSMVYLKDENRYSMEHLARLIKDAISDNVITYDDLYTDEHSLIYKLTKDAKYLNRWLEFRNLDSIDKSDEIKDGYYLIRAKKRYIDPLVVNKGRVSSIYKEAKEKIDEFLSMSFEYYLRGYSK